MLRDVVPRVFARALAPRAFPPMLPRALAPPRAFAPAPAPPRALAPPRAFAPAPGPPRALAPPRAFAPPAALGPRAFVPPRFPIAPPGPRCAFAPAEPRPALGPALVRPAGPALLLAAGACCAGAAGRAAGALDLAGALDPGFFWASAKTEESSRTVSSRDNFPTSFTFFLLSPKTERTPYIVGMAQDCTPVCHQQELLNSQARMPAISAERPLPPGFSEAGQLRVALATAASVVVTKNPV